MSCPIKFEFVPINLKKLPINSKKVLINFKFCPIGRFVQKFEAKLPKNVPIKT